MRPRNDATVRVEGGCLELRLSPVSWTAVALTTASSLTHPVLDVPEMGAGMGNANARSDLQGRPCSPRLPNEERASTCRIRATSFVGMS